MYSPNKSPPYSPPHSHSSTHNTQQQQQPNLQTEKYASILQNADAIMELNAAKTSREYLTVGGKPENILKFLSEGYRGYPQMCELMCNWMKLANIDSKTISDAIEGELKALIIDRFDPKKADMIFVSSRSGAPIWLEHLITQPNWRSLLYQLSENYPHCLFLNFSIQKVSELGLQGEIASLSTASTYFTVFNRVLSDQLDSMRKMDQDALSDALIDLQKMCCHSQHTYLYAQTLLSNLIKKPNGYPLKLLAQELENTVRERGSIVRRISSLLGDGNKHSTVTTNVSSILNSGATPGDVSRLYTEYSKSDPPPVDMIRHPELLSILVADLFNPLKTPNPMHRSKYVYVLAYAVSVRDERAQRGILDKSGIQDTINAIDTVQPITQKNPVGAELNQAIPIIKEYLRFPVISMGIIQWIKINLYEAHYFVTSYTPIHLELLREVAIRHPLLHQPILEIIAHCFIKDSELDSLAALEMKRNLLDNIIFLMKCGCVLPVLHIIQGWTSGIDHGLLRHFMTQILNSIEPPYSLSFSVSMLNIISSSQSIIEALKGADSKDLVSQFITHCDESGLDFGEKKQLLTKLQEAFCK